MAGHYERPLTGEWEGWTQHGGGGSYSITNAERTIILHYDIAGSAIGMHRSSASVSRPWQAQAGGRALLDASGRPRTFGSRQSARNAALAAIDRA